MLGVGKQEAAMLEIDGAQAFVNLFLALGALGFAGLVSAGIALFVAHFPRWCGNP